MSWLEGYSLKKTWHTYNSNPSYIEKQIENTLKQNDIRYAREVQLCDYPFRYDFAININDYIFLLEYHGDQHYNRNPDMQTEEQFEKQQMSDKEKVRLAEEHSIELIVIDKKNYDELEHILEDLCMHYCDY